MHNELRNEQTKISDSGTSNDTKVRFSSQMLSESAARWTSQNTTRGRHVPQLGARAETANLRKLRDAAIRNALCIHANIPHPNGGQKAAENEWRTQWTPETGLFLKKIKPKARSADPSQNRFFEHCSLGIANLLR